jgi:hypothetical protein
MPSAPQLKMNFKHSPGGDQHIPIEKYWPVCNVHWEGFVYAVESFENSEHVRPKFSDVVLFNWRICPFKVGFQGAFVCIFQNKIMGISLGIASVKCDQMRVWRLTQSLKSFNFQIVFFGGVRKEV